MLTIDALAQEIRRVDGENSLGAGALAEALYPALSALVEGQPVAVKAPEWKKWPEDGTAQFEGMEPRRRYLARALTPFGAIFLMSKNGSEFTLVASGSHKTHEGSFMSTEDAKAAAQADYEQRIRSALAPAPAGEDDLVKAAKAVEEWWLSDGLKHFTGAPYAIFALRAALSRKGSDAQTVGGGMAMDTEAPAQHVAGSAAREAAIKTYEHWLAITSKEEAFDHAIAEYLIATASPSSQPSASTQRDPLPSDADDMGDGAGGVAKGGA